MDPTSNAFLTSFGALNKSIYPFSIGIIRNYNPSIIVITIGILGLDVDLYQTYGF